MGHVISADGVKLDPPKIEAITEVFRNGDIPGEVHTEAVPGNRPYPLIVKEEYGICDTEASKGCFDRLKT